MQLGEPAGAVAGQGEGHVLASAVVEQRHRFDQPQPVDLVRHVQSQAGRHVRAEIVPRHREAAMAEPAHQGEHVVGELTYGQVRGQVGAHHGAAVAQRRRHPVPHRVGLRLAVQQQQRRRLPARDAAGAKPVARPGQRHLLVVKPGEEHAAHIRFTPLLFPTLLRAAMGDQPRRRFGHRRRTGFCGSRSDDGRSRPG